MKELEKQGKKTFLDVLTERVAMRNLRKGIPGYVVDGLGAWFIIDGYDFENRYKAETHEDVKYHLTSA